MHFEILTAVPELVEGYLGGSILGRAAEAGVVSFCASSLRDHGEGKHKQIDDSPYGGGSGMVMKPGPLVAALEAARSRASGEERVRVVMTHPAGVQLDRDMAHRLASDYDRVIVLCGRYEGIDARVEHYVDEWVSLGDFILTGGELVALSLVDAVSRFLPGVLGNESSSIEESFEGSLLEYPQYTRPRDFRGAEVPEVLLSGDHGKIAEWRHARSLDRTRRHRPGRLLGSQELRGPDESFQEKLDDERSEE